MGPAVLLEHLGPQELPALQELLALQRLELLTQTRQPPYQTLMREIIPTITITQTTQTSMRTPLGPTLMAVRVITI